MENVVLRDNNVSLLYDYPQIPNFLYTKNG